MDGIFGVGVAEVLIIGLVLFVIGGPENTAKWARELGRWVRKGREMWAEVMAQLENELGEDGKEIVDAAREVGQEVRGLRSATSPRGVMRSALGAELKSAESELKNPLAPPPATKKDNQGVTAGDPKPISDTANAASEVGEASGSDAAPDSADQKPARKSGSVYSAWVQPNDTSD